MTSLVKRIRIVKDILIDFGGLIQTVIYVGLGISWLFKRIEITNSYKKIALALLLLTILVFFLRRVLYEISAKTKNILLEERVETDINELTDSAKKAKLKLPTSNQLARWEKLLCSKAEKWDEECKKDGMTLHLEHDREHPKIHGQISFYSEWLQQKNGTVFRL